MYVCMALGRLYTYKKKIGSSKNFNYVSSLPFNKNTSPLRIIPNC